MILFHSLLILELKFSFLMFESEMLYNGVMRITVIFKGTEKSSNHFKGLYERYIFNLVFLHIVHISLVNILLLWQPDDQSCVGEMGLVPVYLGATNRLLNADHYKVYFDGMPIYRGVV